MRLWENPWAEFVTFLEYDVEVRRVIATTNAIESINARYRRAVKARGHFPDDASALKCLYLVNRSLDPTGAGRARWMVRWKRALNAFAITFAGRSTEPFIETAGPHTPLAPDPEKPASATTITVHGQADHGFGPVADAVQGNKPISRPVRSLVRHSERSALRV